jgi:hypothetical protein
MRTISIDRYSKISKKSFATLNPPKKLEDAPNLVYTLVPLENLAVIEKEIKHCLLELVNID